MTPTARSLFVAYLLTMVCFLALDACWLSLAGPILYSPRLGSLMAPEVDWTAAALFYIIYLAGLLVFGVVPALKSGRPAGAVLHGGFFGLVAYATYDLTNQATLSGWPWSVTAADLVWGMFASGTASGLATWATRKLLIRGKKASARGLE